MRQRKEGGNQLQQSAAVGSQSSTRSLTISLLNAFFSGKDSHLPGLAASPACIRGDPQCLAARLLGHEGELTHGTTDEGAQVNSRGLRASMASRQQEEQSTQGHTGELHSEVEGRGGLGEPRWWHDAGAKKPQVRGFSPRAVMPLLLLGHSVPHLHSAQEKIEDEGLPAARRKKSYCSSLNAVATEISKLQAYHAANAFLSVRLP